MSNIIGVTVGTPTSPKKIEQEIKPVKTVNGVVPDEEGNVQIEEETKVVESFDELSQDDADGAVAIQPTGGKPSGTDSLEDFETANFAKKHNGKWYVDEGDAKQIEAIRTDLSDIHDDMDEIESRVREIENEGGDSLPEVVLTTPVDMGATFTAEESLALSSALEMGKPVIVKCTIMDTPDVVMVMNNFAGQGFVAVYANYNFLLMFDGELWSSFIEEIRVLPEVTEDDNGKFLQVVDGAIALVSLTDVSKEGA